MTTRVRWVRLHAAGRGGILIDLRTCAVTATATINGQLLARGVLADSPPVGRALGKARGGVHAELVEVVDRSAGADRDAGERRVGE